MIEVLEQGTMCRPVMLDGKIVGYIHQMGSQFRYVPKGKRLSQGGELMSSVAEIVESLY